MKNVYGEELKKQVLARKQRLQNCINDRMERIANCETDMDDCFISQRIEEKGIQECNMQLDILNGDGTMKIDAVFDENGNEVRTHWFENKWGGISIVGNGVFASSMRALLKKTGWTLKTISVPCWTKYSCSGKGLVGACNGSTEVVRWHTNMVTGEYVGYPD